MRGLRVLLQIALLIWCVWYVVTVFSALLNPTPVAAKAAAPVPALIKVVEVDWYVVGHGPKGAIWADTRTGECYATWGPVMKPYACPLFES